MNVIENMNFNKMIFSYFSRLYLNPFPPEPSSVSLKSDVSKGMGVDFKGQGSDIQRYVWGSFDVIGLLVIWNFKMNFSENMNFNKGIFFPFFCTNHPFCPTPELSSVSLKSDVSKCMGIEFKEGHRFPAER